MENIFDNNIFLLFFGATFYYVIRWSMAKNAKSSLLKARLKLCDSKAEKALVYADDKYKFNFMEWLHDNTDEMVISGFSCVTLLMFDQLASDWVLKNYDIELGKAVYLLGGIGGDMLYRGIVKMQGG